MAEEKFRIRQVAGQHQIWDPVRKKWVALTPEEKVRQWLIVLLNEVCAVPFSLMAVEKGLVVNGLQKRFDLMLYDRDGQAVLIAECKAPEIKLTEAVCQQIAVYNFQFSTRYLLITNSQTLTLFEWDEKAQKYLPIEFKGQKLID
jgi:hypothetical protein